MVHVIKIRKRDLHAACAELRQIVSDQMQQTVAGLQAFSDAARATAEATSRMTLTLLTMQVVRDAARKLLEPKRLRRQKRHARYRRGVQKIRPRHRGPFPT